MTIGFLGLFVLVGVFLLFLGVIAAAAIGIYNQLITLRNRAKNAYAQIDVQLNRRHDLIPNLVETVKGYLKHESGTLEAVISARGAAVNANRRAAADPADPVAIQQAAAAETGLNGALGRLLAVAEAYPDLKASQNMAQLTEELTSTENKIAFARQAYNDSVLAFNTLRETFPSNLIANFFNFTAAALFELEDPAKREAPKVSFSS
jgi:LemA protein